MFKRFLTGILMMAMVLSVLAGCGKDKDSAGTDQNSDVSAVVEESEKTEAETETVTEEVTEEVTEAETEAKKEEKTEIDTDAVTEADTEEVTEAASEDNNTADSEQPADDGKQVEYGSTIKVHYVFQSKYADSDEFVTLEEGDKSIVVSKETTDVFSPYDYEVEEEQIMENVNKAIGLKAGDSFVIGCEGGDGWYETVYQILEIQ
ncbi:MAG: hypothetical protein J5517_01770 [Eubacterium sp.]|nr:hypothetical protein [Eubacterium sp.]